MDTSFQNTIQEHMKKLPEGIQQAIRLSGWERKILEIGRKHGLHVDQMEVLQTELSLAILGLSPRDEFVREVRREAGIPTEQLNEIVLEINHQIFEPIRDYLRKFQESENVREQTKMSMSGLHQTEEDILKNHGFDFDTHHEPSTTISSEGRFPEVRVDQRKPIVSDTGITSSQSVLPQPLKLNSSAVVQKQQENMSMNIRDIMSVGLGYDGDLEEEGDGQVESAPQTVVQTPSIVGEEVDMNALRSAQTSEHQKIISTSGVSGYQSKDPYREPIE